MIRRSALGLVALVLLVAACASLDLDTYAEMRTKVQADLDEVRRLFTSVGAAYDEAHGASPPRITNAQYRPWRFFALYYQHEIVRIGSEVTAARVREGLTAIWPDILALKADLLRLQVQLDDALARKGIRP